MIQRSARSPSQHGQRLSVGPNASTTFFLTFSFNANKPPNRNLNGDHRVATAPALNVPEYDGFITLSDGTEHLTLPWQVCPAQGREHAARVETVALNGGGSASLTLTNTGGARSGRGRCLRAHGDQPAAIEHPFNRDRRELRSRRFRGGSDRAWYGSGVASPASSSPSTHTGS